MGRKKREYIFSTIQYSSTLSVQRRAISLFPDFCTAGPKEILKNTKTVQDNSVQKRFPKHGSLHVYHVREPLYKHYLGPFKDILLP